MFCPKCGNRLEDGATICDKCGHQFQQTPEDKPAAPKSFNKRRVLIVAIAVIVVLAFTTYGVSAFLRGNAPPVEDVFLPTETPPPPSSSTPEPSIPAVVQEEPEPEHDEVAFSEGVIDLFYKEPAEHFYSDDWKKVTISSDIFPEDPQVGDIIILPPTPFYPGGRAVKVREVQTAGNLTTMTITEPALHEVFGEIEISTSFVPDPQSIVEIHNARQNVVQNSITEMSAVQPNTLQIVPMAFYQPITIRNLADTDSIGLNLSVTSDGRLSIAGKYQYADDLGFEGEILLGFGETTVEVEDGLVTDKVVVDIPVETETKLTVKGTIIDTGDAIKIPIIPFVVPTPVPTLTLSAELFLKISISGEIEMVVELKNDMNSALTNNPPLPPSVSVSNVSEPEANFELMLKANGAVTFPLELGVNIAALSVVSITPEYGVGTKAEIQPFRCNDINFDVNHVFRVSGSIAKIDALSTEWTVLDDKHPEAAIGEFHYDMDEREFYPGRCAHDDGSKPIGEGNTGGSGSAGWSFPPALPPQSMPPSFTGSISMLHAPTHEFEDTKPFSNGVSFVKKNGKWGAVNTRLETVIPFEYDDVGTFSEGLVAARRDNRWGYIDSRGRTVIPFEYLGASPFSGNVAAVTSSGTRVEYIDKSGSMVFWHTGTGTFYGGYGAICVWRTNERNTVTQSWVRIIDTTGAQVANIESCEMLNSPPPKGSILYLSPQNDGFCMVTLERQNMIGNTDSIGRQRDTHIGRSETQIFYVNMRPDENNKFPKIGWAYHIDEGRNFSEGYAAVFGGSIGSSWSFIDAQGEVRIKNADFTNAGSFIGGLAPVKSRENGYKWAYINRSGIPVSGFDFDDARDFGEGLAWVKVGELWGVVSAD